jgi:hypothetical protein
VALDIVLGVLTLQRRPMAAVALDIVLGVLTLKRWAMAAVTFYVVLLFRALLILRHLCLLLSGRSITV